MAAQDCSTPHRPPTNLCALQTPKSQRGHRSPRYRPKTPSCPTSPRRDTRLQEVLLFPTPQPPRPLPQSAPIPPQPASLLPQPIPPPPQTTPPQSELHPHATQPEAQQPLPSLGSSCLEPPTAPSQAQYASGLSLSAFIMGLTPLALKFINLLLTDSNLQESLLQCLPRLFSFFTSLTQ